MDICVCSRLRRGSLKSERSDGPFGSFWSFHFQSLENQMQFSDCVFRAPTSFRQRGFFFVLFCCAQTMRNVRGPHLLDHSENHPTSLGIQIPERKRGRNGDTVNIIWMFYHNILLTLFWYNWWKTVELMRPVWGFGLSSHWLGCRLIHCCCRTAPSHSVKLWHKPECPKHKTHHSLSSIQQAKCSDSLIMAS